VFGHLVLPAEGDVTPTELVDGLLPTMSAAVTDEKQQQGKQRPSHLCKRNINTFTHHLNQTTGYASQHY